MLSLAPDLSTDRSVSSLETPESTKDSASNASGPDQPGLPADEIGRSQGGLLQLLSMLQDEFGEEESDELWAMAADLHDDDEEWEDEEEGEHAHEGL